MRLFYSSLFFMLSGLFLSPSVRAFPLNYLESSEGDFPADVNGRYKVLTFDLGINTVTGIFGLPIVNGPGDFDPFSFTIPTGTILGNSSVVVNDVRGNVTDTTYSFVVGGESSQDGTVIASFRVLSPGSANFATNTPYYSKYHINHNAYGGSPGGTDYIATYAFSFTVVPEPASLSLIAFAGLALRRRARG